MQDARPATACRAISPEYQLALGERLAAEAARLVTEATGLTQFQKMSYGDEKPVVSYPDRKHSTAGEWNAAARANNRIVFLFREEPRVGP